MGTWGAGIFSNDLSADVRTEYRWLLEDGVSDADAMAQVLSRFAHADRDHDDATAFWTGLAASQLQLGRLDPAVRDRAVALIDAGGDLHLWTESRDAPKRKAALAKLRGQLFAPARPPVRVKKPKRMPSPVAAGDVCSLALDDGRTALLHVIAVQEFRFGDFPVIEMIDSEGRPYKRPPDRIPRPPQAVKPEATARWLVVAPSAKDLPSADVLRVTGRRPIAGRDSRTITSTSWRGTRLLCQRILDTPEAQPEAARPWFGRFLRRH